MRKVFSVRVVYRLNRLVGMSTSFFLLGVSGKYLVGARYVFSALIFQLVTDRWGNNLYVNESRLS